MPESSPNFHHSELECKCGCGLNKTKPSLIYLLECIRTHFDKPVVISSGTRCKKHNIEEKGKKRSRHLYGDAADIVVYDIPAPEVAQYAEWLIRGRGGIGTYEGFTHVDTRGYAARWNAVTRKGHEPIFGNLFGGVK